MDIEGSLHQIERCRYASGLYSAVPADSGVLVPLYRNMWIRDTVYTLLAYEAVGDIDRLREGVHALFDRVLLRWAYRLDWRIVEGVPEHDIEYLHPRFLPDGSEIYTELWGLRQDDAVGLALWALGRWQERFVVFRNDYEDFHLLQKLVWYLDRIDHPNLPDAGIWEEEGPTKAVHLSSVAAVAAGLVQAARIGVKDIPDRLQQDTVRTLLAMRGRESQHHDTDLALLTLVWPLGDDLPMPRASQREIVERVEDELLGTRGVVRYRGDGYHTCAGEAPEWTMGLGFLALAWNALGERERAVWYQHKLQSVATASDELPESWCHDPAHYEFYNSPLCWSHALNVVAGVELERQQANLAPPHRLDAPGAAPRPRRLG
ncbi:MAG: glycoside hydrolase family 15 protein [Pseudonocardiaceae bacterium]